MNICVISNSHAASLKDGWTSLSSSLADTNVTFFAAPNLLMADLKANLNEKTLSTDNVTVSNTLSFTSGGLKNIDVQSYDAFLVYGLFLSVPRLDCRHSLAVKKATVVDSITGSENYRFVADLCNMTEAPVFYSPCPLLSDSILDDEVEQSSVYHTYEEICEWIDEQYDFPNSILTKQLSETMGRDLTTLKKYSKGSTRLTKQVVEHVSHDVMHMNADYGERFMKMFLLDELACVAQSGRKVA